MRSLQKGTLLLAAALLVAAGCNKKVESDFTPRASDARSALEAGLNAWKGGEKPGDVPGKSKPTVHAEDPEWSAGQHLREYEILSEAPLEGAQGRVFTVKILTDKGGPHEVKYVVFGIDPVQVFHESTYKGMSGMGK
jgi:hypothetical protein